MFAHFSEQKMKVFAMIAIFAFFLVNTCYALSTVEVCGTDADGQTKCIKKVYQNADSAYGLVSKDRSGLQMRTNTGHGPIPPIGFDNNPYGKHNVLLCIIL